MILLFKWDVSLSLSKADLFDYPGFDRLTLTALY